MTLFPKGALLGFLVVFLVFAATQCQADEQVIEVVGIGECSDCKELKIHDSHAFPGLHVTIDCKNQFGTIERWGVGELNKEGKFKVSIPKEMLKDGNLKHECYAQLHSASLTPCPAHNGLKSIKLVAKNDADGKHITFEPATFSAELCTSATFLPSHKPLPKLPKIDWKHHFGHHYKFPPLYKKPLPPTSPTPVPKTPEPPVTIPKTPEPPVTIPKTPKPPVTKTEPPSKPKKPCPLEYKKKPKPEEPKKKKPEKPKKEEPKKQMPPVVKPPVEKPPVVTPPIISRPIEKPPIKKLPCPPIPKLPPKDYHHPKLPPLPTIPPKYLHHPKLPHLPPSPHIPHAQVPRSLIWLVTSECCCEHLICTLFLK